MVFLRWEPQAVPSGTREAPARIRTPGARVQDGQGAVPATLPRMDPHALKQMMESFIPFNAFLGVRATHIHKELLRLEVPFRAELVGDPIRPALHGGVLSA